MNIAPRQAEFVHRNFVKSLIDPFRFNFFHAEVTFDATTKTSPEQEILSADQAFTKHAFYF